MFLMLRLFVIVGLTVALFTYYRRPPATEAFLSSPITSLAIGPRATTTYTSGYELDNLKFEQAVRKTFTNSQNCPNMTDIGTWTQMPVPDDEEAPENVRKAYAIALAYLTKGIASSKHFDIAVDSVKFDPADDERTPNPVKIKHPRLVSYRTKSTELLLQIEMVLRRDFKYQAKHVEMWVHVNGSQVNVVVANVAGVLFEDAFAMAPNTQDFAMNAESVKTRLPSDIPVPKKKTNEFAFHTPPIPATCPYSGP